MQRLSSLAVVIGVLCLPLISGEARSQLQPEFQDLAKVFEGFRSGLALFDIDSDGDLDCLTTVQEDYDASVPSAVYTWFFKAVNGHEARNISFYFRAGDAPGQVLLKDKNVDGPLQNGAYDYSDYKNCVVVEMPYENSQECMLWITWEAKNKVPQRCTDEYEDACDNAKEIFDDDTCSPFLEVNGS
ncbi:uncharacterized protein LOC119440403 isoform X2 [Dermacentor silvarum]|uniref:uncharacterized protein LOC119440403 isoform X2 n=1 Tax=Dermacentor silvarum TaxID=543639 RepID=UPI002101D263|nr:uncharacterized protein LOC119440403 isoform X2 [Dermacentor silvarum]